MASERGDGGGYLGTLAPTGVARDCDHDLE